MNRGLTNTAVAFAGSLKFIALAISLAVIASSAQSSGNLNSTGSSKKHAVCTTSACAQAASRILANMNSKIAPCDDFYQFACGGFERSTTIPDEESVVSEFSLAENRLHTQLRASIEEPSGACEPRHITLTKNFYRACMNADAIEEAGVKPLLEILEQLGSWPVLEGDNWKGDFDWTEIVYLLQKLSYSTDYFLTFSITVDLKNSAMYTLQLDQASLGLDREYLINGKEDEIVKAYYDYIVDLAVIVGADKEKAIQELGDSLEFEIELAKISSPDEKRRNFTELYNPVTIAELNERYPSVNWTRYINNALISTATVDENEIVVVEEPRFISDLIELLKTTPKRVQANYVMSRVTIDSVSFLTEAMRDRELEYNTKLSGETRRDPRWKECLNLLTFMSPISAGALYVRNYFTEDAKQTAVAMVAELKNQFTKILEKAEWMDAKTKRTALGKIAAMTTYVAYPSELHDDNQLNEYFAPLELRPDDLFGNGVNVTILNTNYYLANLRQPVNQSDWKSHSNVASTDDVYYYAQNSISIPAGLLQEPFFSNELPRYMNYGGIGFINAQGMTLGFDNLGNQFDKDGNLVNWWAPETMKRYSDKAQCFVNQYGNYTVKSVGMDVNGVNTEGSNIADNGGIKMAYLAYNEWANKNSNEPKLPGLNYTAKQMFWISSANLWCSKYRPEALKLKVETDAHSPEQFRVIGPLSNRPEFAKDFNCPVGSTMNPKQRCSVW